MALRTYAINTSDVNVNGVMDTLRANFPDYWIEEADPVLGVVYSTSVIVTQDTIIIDDAVSDSALNTIVSNNTASVESKTDAQNAETTTKDNVIARILLEADKETPDWATLYADALAFVTARPAVLRRFNNLLALYALANGITISLLPQTQQKAIRLQVLIQMATL